MKKNRINIPITVTELSEFAVNRARSIERLKATKAKRISRLNRNLEAKNNSGFVSGNAAALRGIQEHKRFEKEIGQVTENNRLSKYTYNRLMKDGIEKSKLVNEHAKSSEHGSLVFVIIVVLTVITLAWN